MITTPEEVDAMHRALMAFGYDTLTHEEVREAAVYVREGKAPRNIIEMWVRGWLEEAKLL